MAKLKLSGSCVEIVVTVTDEMTKAATGLTINQIDMLRAVFEDRHGIDPATLTMDAIASIGSVGIDARARQEASHDGR